jgi:hypothetical protein
MLGVIDGEPAAPGWVELVDTVVCLLLVVDLLRLAVPQEHLLSEVFLVLYLVNVVLSHHEGVEGLCINPFPFPESGRSLLYGPGSRENFPHDFPSCDLCLREVADVVSRGVAVQSGAGGSPALAAAFAPAVAPLPSFIPFPAAGAVFVAFATAPFAGASAAVRAAFSPSVAVLAGFLAPVRLPLLSPSPGPSLLPALSPVQKPILILDIWHGGLQTNHREPNAPDLDLNPAI